VAKCDRARRGSAHKDERQREKIQDVRSQLRA
jgi:hypothetical protein